MIKIYTNQNKHSLVLAAEAFADLWQKVTGNRPETCADPEAETCDLVLIGTDAELVFLHDLRMKNLLPDLKVSIGMDGYRILSLRHGNRNLLILAASGMRAPLYAVYDYFERAGNCAYFWDGDRIPQAETLPLTGFDILEQPRFRYRGLRYFAHRGLTRFQAEHWDFEDWKRELDWIMKKRMNFFMLRFGIDDLFQRAFPDMVPYPEKDMELTKEKARSFDNRNEGWSLKARGELRKKVMAYAQKRGMISPEDCGTMTHWYSRTPEGFLEKVNPEFLPQANGFYGEKSGLVWDITQDKYLDLYWQLTETAIREWGDGRMFHTIGLAERGCYSDPAQNHQMKLYVYRRIQEKLREKYPDAPLLIGTWDFVERWTLEQVKDLLNELDPERTILFDYVSDIYDEINNFTNWGVVKEFPYFFGIFQAYQSSTEIRGNYPVIERRLPVAAADPMCKGMVLWPENSHADTLMTEYLAANAWNPVPENIKISSFLETFLEKRYGGTEYYEPLGNIWRSMLPLIQTHYWRTRADERWRDLYPDLIFNPILRNMLYQQNNDELENCSYLMAEMAPVIGRAADCFRSLAALRTYENAPEEMDAMPYRDVIDLARTAALRVILYGTYRIQLALDAWRKHQAEFPAEMIGALEDVISGLADILDAHADYSLYDSLLALRAKGEVNPTFESTLKGNVENWYSRSFLSELFRACYIPEYQAIRESLTAQFHADDRSFSGKPESLNGKLEAIKDAFYETPLQNYAPDHKAAQKKLNQVLLRMAELTDLLTKC